MDDLHGPVRVRLHGTGHDQFGPHILRSESGQIERKFEMVTASHEDRLVADPGTLHIHDLHGGHAVSNLCFPGDDLARNGEIVIRQIPLAGRQPARNAPRSRAASGWS